MVLLVIIAVVFVGATAALVARAVSVGRMRMLTQVRQIEDYGFNADVDLGALEEDQESQVAVAAHSLAERVGRFGEASLSMHPLPRVKLLSAGFYRISPYALNGYRILLAVFLPGLELISAIGSGHLKALNILFALVLGLLGFTAPKLIVLQRSAKRLDSIDRSIPELIDVLIATIEAGLSFAGSLQLVADRFHGPLGQELRLTLREQTMGLSTEKSLENMLQRCDTPSIRSFVRAVGQAEALGVSIGQMMRSLARETRDRRRQLAHERVQKAPVKMLFPLVFLIFPAMLIVLLYPAIHSIVHQLGSG
jgi:tight adherence protein C